MDNEITREDVLNEGQESQAVDNSPEKEYNSSEDNGRDPSQDLLESEIPDNFKEQFGLPDTYTKVKDILRGYKERATLNGQHGSELGEARRQIQELTRAYEELRGKISGIGGKSQEEVDQEVRKLLSENPKGGISQIAKEVINGELKPILEEIQEARVWRQRQEANNECNEFFREHNVTKEDEEELKKVIAADKDYYGNLLNTGGVRQVLRAARVELLEKRGQQVDTKNRQAKEEQAAKEKKAQVLTSTHSRPSKNTGGDDFESIKEQLYSSIQR